MASYLTKNEVLVKLERFNVKSVSCLNRLIREQGLPACYISPRKVFFDEAEIDNWMAMRKEVVSRANATQVKIARYQRTRRKEAKEAQEGIEDRTPRHTPITAKSRQAETVA